jgi:hypothetical protein
MATSHIATLRLKASRPGEDPFDLNVEIGAPVQVGPDEWVCSSTISPLGKQRRIHGIDSLQALVLAAKFTLTILKHFVEDGGALQYDDGTPFTGEGYG